MSSATVLGPLAPEPIDPVAEVPVPFAPGIPRSRPRRPRAHPRPAPATGAWLPAEGALFPWIARRFAPGEATLWVAPEAILDRLLGLLYVGSAAVGGRISLLEGANRFDPYRIAEGGRALGVDPGAVLEGIRLARAFTAYQLVRLVERWARESRAHRPTLLVGHHLPLLFESEEVPLEERAPLLAHVADQLRRLLAAQRCPLLLTLPPPGLPGRFPGLAEHGPRLFDLVRGVARGDRLELRAYREAAVCRLVPRRPGQHGLEEFGPLDDPATEVIAWDAPPRRTGRRSRNA